MILIILALLIGAIKKQHKVILNFILLNTLFLIKILKKFKFLNKKKKWALFSSLYTNFIGWTILFITLFYNIPFLFKTDMDNIWLYLFGKKFKFLRLFQKKN